MNEPKFKIGQVMVNPHNANPLPIAEIVTCYRFVKDIGALWREDELSPYVRPLAVGDRVRRTDNDRTGTLKAVHGHEACYLADSGCGLVVVKLANLERIPTEAGQ